MKSVPNPQSEQDTVLKRLVVVVDYGSASAAEIGSSLSPSASLIFVVEPSSDYVVGALSILEKFGTVVPYAGALDLDNVVDRIRPLDAAGITTFSERQLRLTATLAAALNLPYNSAECVDLLTDKHRQRTRLITAGVSRVPTYHLTSPNQWPTAVRHTGLPAVIKPVVGESSRNTFLAASDDEGARLLEDLMNREGAGAEPSFVVEGYIGGRAEGQFANYVSVECAVQDYRPAVYAVTGKLPQLPPFREVGQFWPAHLDAVESAAVRTLACHAVEALGMRVGLAHVEIKLTPSGPEIIEVNGRLGGLQHDLALRSVGLDVVALAGSLALGADVLVDEAKMAGVCFQYYVQAPTFPCTFVGVAGVNALMIDDRIDSYRPMVRGGAKLNGGVATTILGVIAGRTEDHSTMLETIALALSRLTFHFTRDDLQRNVSGSALAAPERV